MKQNLAAPLWTLVICVIIHIGFISVQIDEARQRDLDKQKVAQLEKENNYLKAAENSGIKLWQSAYDNCVKSQTPFSETTIVPGFSGTLSMPGAYASSPHASTGKGSASTKGKSGAACAPCKLGESLNGNGVITIYGN